MNYELLFSNLRLLCFYDFQLINCRNTKNRLDVIGVILNSRRSIGKFHEFFILQIMQPITILEDSEWTQCAHCNCMRMGKLIQLEQGMTHDRSEPWLIWRERSQQSGVFGGGRSMPGERAISRRGISDRG